MILSVTDHLTSPIIDESELKIEKAILWLLLHALSCRSGNRESRGMAMKRLNRLTPLSPKLDIQSFVESKRDAREIKVNE